MKRYKILKYPWHTGHDYELAKMEHDFYYLTTTYKHWSENQRSIPQNIHWVSSPQEIDADVMILHLDQWSYYEPAKRFLFLNQKHAFHGPKIVIIHGCNMADGCTREEMAKLTEGCHIVCNSYTAEKLWDLPQARTILHGFSPDEWPQTNYENNTPVIVQPNRERWKKTTNRNFINKIEEKTEVSWIGRDHHFSGPTEYLNFLSSHSIFVNPSHASANPRARAEAMLMGLAVVTTASQGEERYIENGVNGFASDNEEELLDFLLKLKKDTHLQKKIGMNGKETARKLFHIDRFKEDWDTLLHDTTST